MTALKTAATEQKYIHTRVIYTNTQKTKLACKINYTHTLDCFFLELLQVRPVPKSKLLEIVAAELLHARCPSCRPTNRIKVSKDDGVPDCEQYAAWKTVMAAWAALPSNFYSVSLLRQ